MRMVDKSLITKEKEWGQRKKNKIKINPIFINFQMFCVCVIYVKRYGVADSKTDFSTI